MLYDKAIADFSKSIELDVSNPVALLNRALAYLRTKNLAQGLEDATRSVLSNNSRSFTIRGHILEALGRREEAIASFERALELDSTLVESRDALDRLVARRR
jgi:predicted RNA polymerase sigma factor